ncbi:MAG: WecB/TagA/CpsF family glycosyltransferase [Patescibacteria group bacterium]
MKKLTILGINVTDISLIEAQNCVQKYLAGPDQHYITTPNPEIVLTASSRGKLRAIFDHADLSLPDGFGLKIGARILGEKLDNRITGADFMLEICKIAAEQGAPIFLLGGHNDTAKKAGNKLKTLFPALTIAGAESGGEVIKKNCEWHSSDITLIDKINASGSKIIFVGFGCPKQEKWIRDNLYKLTTVKLAMAVGGSLDFLAGTRQRAPRMLRQLGLEWLWRLLNEPTRLPRIWNATIKFIYRTITWRLRMKNTYRNNVAGFVINDTNQVLLVERANEKNEHWQLPQGGVDDDESEEQAVLREMREEVGATNLKIVGKHSQKHTYDWPAWHQLRGGYKGQSQTIFYLRFDANSDKIAIDEKEIKSYQWVDIDKAVSIVHPMRRAMTEMAVEGYRKIINNQTPIIKK